MILDTISNLFGSVVGGVTEHFKGKQELKRIKLEADKEMLSIDAKARVAIQQAKIDMLKSSQDNDFKLDMIAMQNMNRSYKDDFILAIFLLPLVAAFIPEAQGYIMGGFQLMAYIPDWWIYLTIGMVVSIMGLRGLLRDFLKGKKVPIIKK